MPDQTERPHPFQSDGSIEGEFWGALIERIQERFQFFLHQGI